MQGPKVLADNPQTYKENVELLELDNLNISYSMRDSGQQYEWEINSFHLGAKISLRKYGQSERFPINDVPVMIKT